MQKLESLLRRNLREKGRIEFEYNLENLVRNIKIDLSSIYVEQKKFPNSEDYPFIDEMIIFVFFIAINLNSYLLIETISLTDFAIFFWLL